MKRAVGYLRLGNGFPFRFRSRLDGGVVKLSEHET